MENSKCYQTQFEVKLLKFENVKYLLNAQYDIISNCLK